MATRLSYGSTGPEKPAIRLLSSEETTLPRPIDDDSRRTSEVLVSADDQCRNCAHCSLSSTLLSDTTPHHSKDMK